MYTFRGVWSLRNLTLDGKLYLRDDKNAAFVELLYPLLRQTSLEHVTMCASKMRKIFYFDWLNPISLGTMSATAYIDNVA